MKLPTVLNRLQSKLRDQPTSQPGWNRCSLSTISDDSPSDISQPRQEESLSTRTTNRSSVSIINEEIKSTISSMHESENRLYEPFHRYDYRLTDPTSLNDGAFENNGQINGGNTQNHDCRLATDEKCRERMLDWAFEVRYATRMIFSKIANCLWLHVKP